MKTLLLLSTIWFGVYCNYVCYSVISPFFPQLAMEKGLSAFQYSSVFGVYSLAQITVSTVIGKYLVVIDPKLAIVCSLFVTGTATTLFGLLEYASKDAFLVLSLLVRIFEGAGFAAYFTSILSTIVKMFPTRAGYYVGLTETIVTLGMITGPPIGSFLYALGGFKLPLITFGVLLLATAVFDIFKLHFSEELFNTETESVSVSEYLNLLKLPEALISILCVSLNVITDTFLLITLNTFLEQFGLHTVTIGFMYACIFTSYGLSSPIAGRIADYNDSEIYLQLLGSIIMALAFILIASVEKVDSAFQVWVLVSALLLKGVGAGPLISCSYSGCLKAYRAKRRAPDNLKTYTMVSTVISFSIPLGNLIGGFSSGVIYEYWKMEISAQVFAGIFVFLAVVCSFFSLRKLTNNRHCGALTDNHEIIPIFRKQEEGTELERSCTKGYRDLA